ncbi:MAG: AI-2E family transporter [Anaerolineales bacterium]|nr:AI-2E family transporter [Anaerolineales bacterium]MBS3753536.1 AI-2E family transporter [Anaerolineales bacterium]
MGSAGISNELYPQPGNYPLYSPPALLALLKFGWTRMLIVIIGYIATNTFIENILKPRMLGADLNISPPRGLDFSDWLGIYPGTSWDDSRRSPDNHCHQAGSGERGGDALAGGPGGGQPAPAGGTSNRSIRPRIIFIPSRLR